MLAPEVPIEASAVAGASEKPVAPELIRKPTDHLYWARTTSADKAPPPKALSVEEARALEAKAAATASGGSAWNKGGNTWEEKKINQWACDTLRDEILPTVTYELPTAATPLPPAPASAEFHEADSVAVRVMSVEYVKGEATYVLSRGKQRVVFELELKLLLEAEVKLGGELQTILTGKLTIPEVSNDELEEAKLPSTAKTTCEQGDAVRAYFNQLAKGAWPGIKASLSQLVEEAKAKWR